MLGVRNILVKKFVMLKFVQEISAAYFLRTMKQLSQYKAYYVDNSRVEFIVRDVIVVRNMSVLNLQVRIKELVGDSSKQDQNFPVFFSISGRWVIQFIRLGF